jgi:hypothetical protein
MTEPERVEVWEEPGGSWCWRYVAELEEGESVELVGNRAEESEADALAAARRAYPHLRPHRTGERTVDEGHAQSSPTGRRRAGAVVVALVAVLVAVGRPRWWTALPAAAAVQFAVHRIRRTS